VTELPRTADVVVIGAGIVGCSAAYHLAAAGAGHVALLEREDAVGRGSTGACAGGFRHQFTTEVNVRLSQASVPMILGFEETHGIPVDIARDGYLFLIRDEATWTGFQAALEDQRGWGVTVDVLDAEAVRNLVPGVAVDDLVGATFGPNDGIADPGALTQGYATIARDAGARIVTDTEVTRIEPAGVRIDVHTPDGVIHAGAVVLTAGAWSAPLAATAGLDVPIAPVPRTILTTGGFPGVPDRRTLVIDMPSTFYFHREADGVLFGMGGADVETFDTSVDEAYVTDRLLPRALEVFPPISAAGIRSRWAGLYEMTPDRHPIVGPTPVDGLWIAAGFSGHGFQHGPIVGRLLAEMIVGGGATSVDVTPLSAERFARGDLVREGYVV
jgi:glycine/D-amino acid oxidase-like deaminating enzyme